LRSERGAALLLFLLLVVLGLGLRHTEHAKRTAHQTEERLPPGAGLHDRSHALIKG
jgi:hypothetical protein